MKATGSANVFDSSMQAQLQVTKRPVPLAFEINHFPLTWVLLARVNADLQAFLIYRANRTAPDTDSKTTAYRTYRNTEYIPDQIMTSLMHVEVTNNSEKAISLSGNQTNTQAASLAWRETAE